MVRIESRPLEQDDFHASGHRRLDSRIDRAVLAGAAGMIRAGSRLALTGATVAVMAARAGSPRLDGARARARARALRDGCRAVLAHHGIEARVDGLPPIGPALLACNHVSWLDPIVVAAHAPVRAHLQARRPRLAGGRGGWPAASASSSTSGATGARGCDVLREAEAALRGPAWPSSTSRRGPPPTAAAWRPSTGGSSAWRSGSACRWCRWRCATAPADLAWTGDATFVPHYLRLAARGRSQRPSLRFGEPVRADRHSTAVDLADAVRDQVVMLLEAA